MKKSTIIVLVIVYIVSFFLVGLLGQAVRAYDPVVYPESIVLVEPDGIATVQTDVKDPNNSSKILYDYYFVVNPYQHGMSVTIKATVKPDNTSFPNVSYIKDESNDTFNLVTKASDPSVENNYAVITLNEDPDPVLTAKFTVSTQTPGTQIKLKVGITFVNI